MAEKVETAKQKDSEKEVKKSSITVRVPKPNLQVIILALIAFITLFQTIQLLRISSSAASYKAAPAATTNTGTSGSNTDTPESMVGGC